MPVLDAPPRPTPDSLPSAVPCAVPTEVAEQEAAAACAAARPIRELELRLPDLSCLLVGVKAVRDTVAEVEMDRRLGVAMPVGLVAEALLRIKGLGRPLPALVRVLWRHPAPPSSGAERYGLALPALGQRGGALTAALCAAFNRRASQRVRPEPLVHPVVLLEAADGRSARGILGDISLGGLSMQVGAEVERSFANADDVRLTLRLPTARAPLSLEARIRSRRLCGNRVRYGLQFEAAAATRRTVLDYVRERRADCFRRAERTLAPEIL